eukprot:2812473-Pyramimonas_sp.AAC.1
MMSPALDGPRGARRLPAPWKSNRSANSKLAWRRKLGISGRGQNSRGPQCPRRVKRGHGR